MFDTVHNSLNETDVSDATQRNRFCARASMHRERETLEATMTFGRGMLLWLIGIPLPVILLLAILMHH
jgi:hypothetical protein